jgi:hypothetical protein
MSLITININNPVNEAKQDKIIELLNDLGVATMKTQADIDALTAKAEKVRLELVKAQEANNAAATALREQIAELQAQIEAGTIDLDLSGLEAALTILDNFNPDEEALEG